MTTVTVETEPLAEAATPPATKPQPPRPPPVVDDAEPEFYSCIICNRQLLVEAPDDLRDGVFCRSFGNPSSGEHDFATSHEIAEFGICAACWRGAVEFGVIRFRSLTQRVWLWDSTRATAEADTELRDDGPALVIGDPSAPEPTGARSLEQMRAWGFVGVYNTVRVTDGAELMNDGSWRLPSGDVLKPH